MKGGRVGGKKAALNREESDFVVMQVLTSKCCKSRVGCFSYSLLLSFPCQMCRNRLKGLCFIVRNFFQLLLNRSTWPCLAVA